MDFWRIFLENKRIFAKGVRDFLGVKCPSVLPRNKVNMNFLQ